jgi:Protein of unknown function (DUF4058)
LFHDFHQSWTVYFRNALNAGILPKDHFALIEQRTRGPVPDVLTLKLALDSEELTDGSNTLAVATVPPRTRWTRKSDVDTYAAKANRITIRHRHGDVVAIVEIVSPGNKSSRVAIQTFVRKSMSFLDQGVHLLVIDPFPTGKRLGKGIHRTLWDHYLDEGFDLPADKPLILAAYDAGPPFAAYVEAVAVGEVLPEMPLFLQPESYVLALLEETYQETWKVFPAQLNKRLLTRPASS